MDIEKTILDILEELTGSAEVRVNPDLKIFEEELLDSLGTVQFLVEVEGRLGITIPISAFDRVEWATPALVAEKVRALS
jgi:D-alanine--poly(phosphoribitol) ligase subunit 2